MASLEMLPLSARWLEPADEVLQAAFGTPGSRLDDLRRIVAVQPEGWHLARIDRQPMGTVGAMVYGDFAWIGMMAVLPTAQNRGVGRRLLTHILDWLEARGVRVALLDATAAGERLYRQFGFVEVDQACMYAQQREVKAANFPDRLELLQPGNLPEAVKLDRELFGGERGRLLEVFLSDYPQRGWLRRDEHNQVSGYLLAQERRLGPWVARTQQDAEALLAAALRLPYPQGGPVIVSPGGNQQARSLFRRYGFIQVQGLPHMQRGGSQHPCQRQFIYGQTSYAIG